MISIAIVLFPIVHVLSFFLSIAKKNPVCDSVMSVVYSYNKINGRYQTAEGVFRHFKENVEMWEMWKCEKFENVLI